MLRRPDRDGVIVGPPSRASPLPQWDWVYSVGDWSAVRSPSLASQLPQWTGCIQWEIGRLSGRHRWQASSHSGIGCRQLEIGRLSGRLRGQARSHTGLGVFSGRLVGCQAAFAGKPAPTVGLSAGSWRLVGCQAAFASKPAPTVGLSAGSWRLVGCQGAIAGRPASTLDWVYSVRDWSAVRPPSLASQLPQWTGCIQWEIGRLSGRLRWQASSHSGIGCRQLEIGRLSGRLREQAHSYRKAKQSRQTACFSPLKWPSVSSPKALDLAVPAPSAG